jgi:hypothetical protein
MMLMQTILGPVLLGQASAAFAAPFLAMQGWIVASRDE